MDTKEECALISTMLKTAENYGLEVEVVLAFYHVIKNNPEASLKDLVFMALGEWDCNKLEDEYNSIRFVGDDDNE